MQNVMPENCLLPTAISFIRLIFRMEFAKLSGMKRLLFSIVCLVIAFSGAAVADDIVLFDDFEGGLGLWDTQFWGLSEDVSVSPTHSFTESPDGFYPANGTMLAETVVGANLTGYLGASLQFWASYEIEPIFDYCLVEASRDGFFWVNLGSITGLAPFWQLKTYDLGGFAGLPQVYVRFRFFSDPLTVYEGLYVDDFSVIGLEEDTSGPLIIHNGPNAYEGTPFDYHMVVNVWDASGVSEMHAFYRTDGSDFEELILQNQVGEQYYYTIPEQNAGTLVEYYFQAFDGALEMHESVSDTFAYLAGTMLIQDDGVSESILEALPGERAALRFNNNNVDYLTTALVRIYTDSQIDVDSIDVYVWDAGPDRLPRNVISGPYRVWPVSTAEDPEAWTTVDMRADSIQPPPQFFVGLLFSPDAAVQTMALSYDVPAVYNQSVYDDGSGFEEVIFGDFHIRAVVDVEDTTGIVLDPEPSIPDNPQLDVFPNPVNGEAAVVFNLSAAYTRAHLTLYDISGRRLLMQNIDVLNKQNNFKLKFDRNWSSGIYFVRLEAEGMTSQTRKIVYLP